MITTAGLDAALHTLRLEAAYCQEREFPMFGVDVLNIMANNGLCTQAECDAAIAEAKVRIANEERARIDAMPANQREEYEMEKQRWYDCTTPDERRRGFECQAKADGATCRYRIVPAGDWIDGNPPAEPKRDPKDVLFRELARVSKTVDAITAEMDLREDLGMDSLDLIEVIMAVEDALGNDIDDEKLDEMRTVGDVLAYLATIEPAGEVTFWPRAAILARGREVM